MKNKSVQFFDMCLLGSAAFHKERAIFWPVENSQDAIV